LRETCVYSAVTTGTYNPQTNSANSTSVDTPILALVYKGRDTKNGKDPEAMTMFALFERLTYPGIAPSVNDQIDVQTGQYAGLWEVLDIYSIPGDPVWKLKIRLP
jgi:hypothetical protein